MGANFQAGFDCYGNKHCESFEQSCTEFSSLSSEYKNFSLFLTYRFSCVIYQPFLFQLFQKRIDKAWADFLSNATLELAHYAVAMGGSFIEDVEDVKSRKV